MEWRVSFRVKEKKPGDKKHKLRDFTIMVATFMHDSFTFVPNTGVVLLYSTSSVLAKYLLGFSLNASLA
jgi:hypothetical protein